MYVAPRPEFDDDPLFAIRLACMPVIGFGIGLNNQSPMAMMYPIMMFALSAANRKSFNLGRVIGGPLIFTLVLWVVSAFVGMLVEVPSALMAFMLLMYFLGFFVIQISGAPLGMLFIVSVALLGIMGLESYDAMVYTRNEMSKACLTLVWVAPIMYALLPVKTPEVHENEYVPVPLPGHTARAFARAMVMLAYSVFVSVALGFNNVVLAIAGMYVIVHTGRERMFTEVKRRVYAVLLGGSLALALLTIAQISGHLWVILGVLFLFTLYLAHQMQFGGRFYYVYQDAAQGMIAIGASALLTSDPAFAFIQRVVLTLAGTVVAALTVMVMDELIARRCARRAAAPA